MKRASGIELRLEEWGAWRVGGKSVRVATWAALKVQRSAGGAQTDDDARELERSIRAREIDEIVRHLLATPHTADLGRLAMAAYPYRARLAEILGMDRQALAERKKQLRRLVARCLDQRRRGEPIDATRKPKRPRATHIRAQIGRRKTSIASVVLD